MKKKTLYRMPWLGRVAILVLGIAVLPTAAAGFSDKPKPNTDLPKSKILAGPLNRLPPTQPPSQAIDEGENAHPIAWGTPRGGIQAGLRVVGKDIEQRKGEYVAVGGIPLKLEVLVRNVTVEPIRIEYLPPLPIAGMGFIYSDGPVIKAMPVGAGGSSKVSISLVPLKRHQIGSIYVGHHRPKVNSAIDSRPFWTNVGEGVRQIGCTNVLNKPPGTKYMIDTGFIDVRMVPARKGVKLKAK